MANTKTTPRKKITAKEPLKLNCQVCQRKYGSISSLKRHYNNVHSPTLTQYKCLQCERTFLRKDSAVRHIKADHDMYFTKALIEEKKTPRDLATPIKKWIPPIEATKKMDWKKPPKFRLISRADIKNEREKPKESTVNLADDLYISSDEEDITADPPNAAESTNFEHTTYTAIPLETALELSKYSYYQGLEQYELFPHQYPVEEKYGKDENHIIYSYYTAEYRQKQS